MSTGYSKQFVLFYFMHFVHFKTIFRHFFAFYYVFYAFYIFIFKETFLFLQILPTAAFPFLFQD